MTAAELKTAQAAWDAFCSPEPTGLAALVDSDTSALPFLRDALRASSATVPRPAQRTLANGTPYSQAHRCGHLEFRELFPAAQKMEENIWMGDSTFHQYLGGLAGVKHPLLDSVDSGFKTTILDDRFTKDERTTFAPTESIAG